MIAGQGKCRKLGINHVASNQGFTAVIVGSTETSMSGFVSGMSAAYRYETTAQHQDGGDSFYNLVYGVNGVSGPLSPVNNYTDATRLLLEYEGLPGSLRPIYYIGRDGNSVGTLPHIDLAQPESASLYLTPFAADAILNSRKIIVGDDAFTQYYLYGNLITSVASGARSMQIRNYSPLSGYQYGLSSYADDLWVLNGSPHYWSSHGENDAVRVRVGSNHPDRSNGIYFYVRSQWQDQVRSFPTTPWKHNLAPSSAPARCRFHTLEVDAAPDSYRLTMTYNGVLNGTLTNGTTMMEFNTALSDSNPPVLQEIQVLDAGNRREKVLDGHGQIAIRAEDATAGMTLQIDIDRGADWQALPVTYSAGFYRASVQAFAPTDSTSVSLRISAQDLVGNRLVNTIAPAFIVMPDCQPPTVPAVTASQSGNKVQLSWLPTGASQYFVWTSINTPYLNPGANCTRQTASVWHPPPGFRMLFWAIRPRTPSMWYKRRAHADSLLRSHPIEPADSRLP